MDSERVFRELVKQNLQNGVYPSQLRKFCADHNFPPEIVDDALIEIEFDWKKRLGFSIGMLSGWNKFNQALEGSQSALKSMKEWHSEKRAVMNLLIGIYLGIVGNLFASSLIQWQLNSSLFVSGVLLAIVVIYYLYTFRNMRSKDKEYKDFLIETVKWVEDSKKSLEERSRQFALS